MVDNKLLKAKTLRLLSEYGDILDFAIEEELKDLWKGNSLGQNEFETIVKSAKNEGIKEGIRRIKIRLNKYIQNE